MTVSNDESRTCPEPSPIAALATRMLASSNAAVHHQDQTATELDMISQNRYRDANEPEDGHQGDVQSDSEYSGLEGVGATMGRQVDLGEQLRKAIRRSGLTRNQIAKRADLSYSIVHGFVAGTNDLRLATASKIATIVDVDLRQHKTAK